MGFSRIRSPFKGNCGVPFGGYFYGFPARQFSEVFCERLKRVPNIPECSGPQHYRVVNPEAPKDLLVILGFRISRIVVL